VSSTTARPRPLGPWSGRTSGLGAQHVVAMFGATFVFPIVMGLNPKLAIMLSGIATICFLLIVQNRVPSYLGTSASFVGGVVAIRAQGGDSPDVTGAILVAGVVLAACDLIIQLLGSRVVYDCRLVRLVAPPHLREDQRLEGTGRAPRGR